MRAPTICSHNGRFLVSNFEVCQFHVVAFGLYLVGHFQFCQFHIAHFFVQFGRSFPGLPTLDLPFSAPRFFLDFFHEWLQVVTDATLANAFENRLD